MQLKKHVKNALFSCKELFFHAFFILICFKTGEICFLYVKELLQWALKVYPALEVYTFLT